MPCILNCKESFRPLSRYIGLYLEGGIPGIPEVRELLPSPCEVYRFISVSEGAWKFWATVGFPSPLEVYRFISEDETMVYDFVFCFRPLSR